MTTVHDKLFGPMLQVMLDENAFELLIHADKQPYLVVASSQGALTGPIDNSEAVPAEELTAAIESIKAATSSTDDYSGYHLHGDSRFRYFFTEGFIAFRFVAKEPSDETEASEEAVNLMTSPVGPKSPSIFVDEELYKREGAIAAGVDLHDRLVEIYGKSESNNESLIEPLIDKMLEANGSELFIHANEVPRIRVGVEGKSTYPYIEGAEPTPPHEIGREVKAIRKATSGHNGIYFHKGERFRYYLQGDAITLRHIGSQEASNQTKTED